MSGALGDFLEARVRSWFLRNALDTLERLQGPETRDRVSAAVPKRLLPLVARERLRVAAPLDTLSLEDTEDILFSVDASLGHGAGTFMEEVAQHLVTRALVDGSASVSSGDLAGSVVRLRSMFESPFVDVPVLFELTARTPEGFTLAVGVAGRPRATRLLRHYAMGAIRATARFLRESGSEPRVTGESIADRAFISVALRGDAQQSTPPSRPRIKPAVARPSGTAGLVAEVERILKRSESTSSEPPRASSSHPPKRASVRPGRPD